MNSLSIRLAYLLVVMALFIPAFNFGIGDIKDDIIDEILEEIPDFGLGEEDPITTSLDDAITSVPFLDDYEPPYFLPMGELPFGPGGYYLLMPGCYELTIESFCLHAGTHGPGGGDGYILAPLKGPKASIIKHILENSRHHFEIPQRDLQVLIWAILARTKISDMDPHMQQTAATLLTDKEIVELEGFALDVMKNELFEKAFGELPEDVQRVMQAKAELRNTLTSGSWSYNQLESIAVLPGEAPWTDDSEDIPSGRWSFHPDGYFVRYFPHSYPTTDVQVSVPDLCTIAVDGNDRFTYIGDAWGNELEISYSGGMTTYSFTGPTPGKPNDTVTGSWTASGAPAGLSSWEKDHKKEVKELCEGKDIDEILTMGSLAYEVEAAVSGNAGTRAVMLVKQAWQDLVCRTMPPEGGVSLEDFSGKAYGMGGLPGTFAFSPGSFGWFLPDFDNLENMRRIRQRDAEHERIFGEGREKRQLKEFNPTGDVSAPGKRGNQRLANGSRPQNNEEGNKPKGPKPNSYGNAKDGMKNFKRGVSGAKAIGGPIAGPGAGAGMSGFAIPLALSSFMVGETTDVWNDCIGQLGGDPPDPNFDEYAELEIPDYDHVQASDSVPQARADKFNAILDASMNLTASIRAVIVSLDKHGGATEANDVEWIVRQAEALVYYKRLSGIYMYDVADALLAYTDHLRGEGFGGIHVTAQTYAEFQDRLRAEGFNEDELNAMRLLDYSDAYIQASLDEILSTDPSDMEVNFCLALDDLAWVLYAVGWDLYSNWDVKDPNDWDAEWAGIMYVSP